MQTSTKQTAKQVAYTKAVAFEKATLAAFRKVEGKGNDAEYQAGVALINARAERQLAFIRALPTKAA